MREYYTLMDILVTLKKQNSIIKQQISVLNVFLKNEKTFNYEFDYAIENNKVKIKYIHKDVINSKLRNIISSIKNNKKYFVINNNGNYELNKTKIATVNKNYQKYFNEMIKKILNNNFLNYFYLDCNLDYKNHPYHLLVSPQGLYLDDLEKDNFFEFVFDAKKSLLNYLNKEKNIKKTSILNMPIPRRLFSNEIIKLLDESVFYLKESEEIVDDNIVLNEDLTFTLSNRKQNEFYKKK